jgi:hypothetical protein
VLRDVALIKLALKASFINAVNRISHIPRLPLQNPSIV